MLLLIGCLLVMEIQAVWGKLEQCPLKQSLGKRLLIPETSFVQSLARSAPLVKVGAPPSFSANPNTEVTLPNPTLAGDWASQKVCPLEESWLTGNHRLFSSASKLGFRGSGSWEMDPQEFWLAHPGNEALWWLSKQLPYSMMDISFTVSMFFHCKKYNTALCPRGQFCKAGGGGHKSNVMKWVMAVQVVPSPSYL